VAGNREQVLLGDLERRLDGPAFRAAARLEVLWQTRRWRRQPKPNAVRLQSVAEGELVAALSWAMSAGAFESAEQLVGRLLASPEAWSVAGVAGQALAAETLLMLGERERARSIADTHADGLAKNVRGAAVLELVGSPHAPDFLPDGRPSLLRLSRRLSRGELAAEELAELIGASRRTWLRNPELHLLFFSALLAGDSARALRFLNRFLALHGIPASASLVDPGSTGNVLGHLRFARDAAPATASGGPLVSVLVTARNAAGTVGYAVDSLLNQSYPSLEVLVGDDASDDDTLEILKRRAVREPRLRLFRSVRNQGTYNLKNALSQHARGELLTFHDADDLALPDRIARQVERLRTSGKVACIANFARIRPNGSFVFFPDQKTVRLGMVTLMLTRRAFEAVGPFRPARVGADLELFAAARARFGSDAIARVRAPVMLGLLSPSSATLRSGTESLDDGYRSPLRRAYSELVLSSYSRPGAPIFGQNIEARLRETGNYIDAADVWEITSST
jgi:hypothetical protein